mmetsp:Transcript_46721/g.75151  ORF Transcript_46721/g.75151 Transcript_46721/m.75151 type:complete len:309 (+) Transcript_46721:78-1004(+)
MWNNDNFCRSVTTILRRRAAITVIVTTLLSFSFFVVLVNVASSTIMAYATTTTTSFIASTITSSCSSIALPAFQRPLFSNGIISSDYYSPSNLVAVGGTKIKRRGGGEARSIRCDSRSSCGARSVPTSPSGDHYSRRQSLRAGPKILGGAVLLSLTQKCEASKAASGNTGKSIGLPIQDIRDIVQQDFIYRKCLVSGDISQEIYADDCIFTDPQMSVKGLQKFVRGTKALFVAERSELELLGDVYVVGDDKIVAKWREVACFNIPLRPKTYFTGNITLTLGKDNLIVNYLEQWDLTIPEILATARPSF